MALLVGKMTSKLRFLRAGLVWDRHAQASDSTWAEILSVAVAILAVMVISLLWSSFRGLQGMVQRDVLRC